MIVFTLTFLGKTELNVTTIEETFHNSSTYSGQCEAEINDGKPDYGYKVYIDFIMHNIADMCVFEEILTLL